MQQEPKNNAMVKIATIIVDRRNLFFLLFVLAIIFCAISSGWVGVENALSAYLPQDSETRISLDLMEEQFTTYGSAKIMVMNITMDEAEDIRDQIEARKDVYMLVFDETTDHYNQYSALYDITFIYPETDERALASLNEIRGDLERYDTFVSTTMGDQSAEVIEKEMQTVSLYVAVVVLAVLLFTSETYAEVPVLILTFLASAVLAAGTNFIFGTISFVSNSVTIVLQLALSIDYAVIFCNRYKEEHQTLPIREADILALSKAIPEISSSSLTTIGGLIAMMFMQFGIGSDMAICLIKAIIFSLLSVFMLMPGLIMIFGGLMDKTKHKSFVPKIPFVGKIDYLTRFFVPVLFLVLLVGAYWMQKKTPFVYGYTQIETPVENEYQLADKMITEAFGAENKAALIVPAGDYEKEKRLLAALEVRDEVDHCVGLSNTEAMGGYTLTDKLTAREFSELLDLDYEVAELLYTAYAVDDENYAKIINGLSSYSVPLIDMIFFLYQEAEEGYVTLDDEMYDTLKSANDKMTIAKDQLQGEDYSRMLIYLNLPQEGDKTFSFLDEIHEIARVYYDGDVYVAGESTSQYDLKQTFSRDNTVVNVVSILAVLAVLLFTFMSVGMPILLILVIQGAIWINFAFPAAFKDNIFFMSYLIVSSIQMGANIDYAIVISGRYMELRETMPKKEAIIDTMNFAFPTIITSGSMLAICGFIIGQGSSDAAICGIGQCLGRGTIISIILVMFTLPQILMLGEGVIRKTSFNVSMPLKMNRESGVLRIDGLVEGQISGRFVGEMHGILYGDVAAFIQSGQIASQAKNEKETGQEGFIEDGDLAKAGPDKTDEDLIKAVPDKEDRDLAKAGPERSDMGSPEEKEAGDGGEES
ncbi:MAG: MMPL family transporter [Lachnospiraceae bacterium]|nr:MMPL family transporter [Lachnospiraceae bacterium]